MLVRDPSHLYERHGRQLLVTGVQFDGQQQLFALGAAIAHDTSQLCTIAAEAAARYLVGAGLGHLLAPSAWARTLTDIDPELQLADTQANLPVPCVHIHLRQRPHGAEAELAWLGDHPRSCLLLWHSSSGVADAVALGGAVAQLVLDASLGLQPLPAVVAINLQDPLNPQHSSEAPAQRLGDNLPDQPWWPTVEQACREAWPTEAAGTLVRGADGAVTVRLAPASHSSQHFVLPSEFLTVPPLAVWHSHPSGGTTLSAADAAWSVHDPKARPVQLVLASSASAIADFRVYYYSALAGRWLSEAP